METALNILIAAAVAVGLAFDTLGVVGILRFPDAYTRLHADTKATTFGTLFLTLGAALWAVKGWVAGGWDGGMLQQAVHTGIVAVVLAVTNATGSHAIARAAWHAGVKPSKAVCNALEARGAGAEAAQEAPEAAEGAVPEVAEAETAAAEGAEGAEAGAGDAVEAELLDGEGDGAAGMEAEAAALPEPGGEEEAVAKAPEAGAREEEVQG